MMSEGTILRTQPHLRAAAWILLLMFIFLGDFLLVRGVWIVSLLSGRVVYGLPLVACVLMLLLVAWSPNAFGLRLGSHRKVWWIYLVYGLGLAVYYYLRPYVLPIHLLEISHGPGMYLLTPFREELLFRGFIYGVLVDMYPSSEASGRWISKPVLYSSILFGLAHLAWGWQIGWGWGLAEVGYTFVAGLVMGYVRRRSGSLLGPFLMHAVGNFFVSL